MSFAQFIPFLLVLLLMLLQQSELRIIYSNGIKLRVSFTIFAITFFDNGDKTISLAKARRTANTLPLVLKSAKYALKRADVRVLKISREIRPTLGDALFISLPLFLSSASALA